MMDTSKSWWKRIEWIDVVVIVLVVVALLFITSELWLPHYGPR